MAAKARRRPSPQAKKATGKARKATNKSYFEAIAYADERTGVEETTLVCDGWLSTGSCAQDLATGGGNPRGRVSVYWGPEGSGKTTQIYQTILVALFRDIPTILYDFEGSFDIVYLKSIARLHYPALNIDACIESGLFKLDGPTTSGEAMFRHMRRVLRRLDGNTPVLFVLDSVAAVASEDETDDEDSEKVKMKRDKDGKMVAQEGNGGLATSARMWSRSWKKVKPLIKTKQCYLVCADQMRFKVGGFGNPEETSGGNATKHNTDCRIRINKKNPEASESFGASKLSGLGVPGLFDEDSVTRQGATDTYSYHEACTVKNKSFSPFKSYRMRIWASEGGGQGRGLCPVADCAYYLMMTGQLVRSGGYYYLKWLDDGPDAGKEITYTWAKFKYAVLRPGTVKREGNIEIVDRNAVNIRERCFQQIESRIAFKLYERALKDANAKNADPGDYACTAEVLEITSETYRKKGKVVTLDGLCVKLDDTGSIETVALHGVSKTVIAQWRKKEDLIVGQTIRIYSGIDGYRLEIPEDAEVDETPKTSKKPAKQGKIDGDRNRRRMALQAIASKIGKKK